MRRHTLRLGLLIVAALILPGPAAARAPQVLPAITAAFDASYDSVWDATLKSLGVVKVLTADKGQGRIETEPFPFRYQAGSGLDGGTQVIWVSFALRLTRGDGRQTLVQAEPRVHDALLAGFLPGPTNNPWQDLFVRIRSNLGVG